jgi:hypothetical protein
MSGAGTAVPPASPTPLRDLSLPTGSRACEQRTKANARLLDDSELPCPVRATLAPRVSGPRQAQGKEWGPCMRESNHSRSE